MSSKRSLLTFTFGIGLGLALTACAAEQDTDLDLDLDSPELEVMGGGGTLPPPPGSGSGGNGARPAAHCLKAMVQTMSYFAAGWDPNATTQWNFAHQVYYRPYNPAINWVRCNDVLWDPADSSYLYPRLPDVQGTIEAMVWAGGHAGYGVSKSGQIHKGPGWFSRNWAGPGWANVMDPANRDLLGGVITAKWNFNESVPILIQAHGLNGPNTTQTSDPGPYTLREAMVFFDPDAPAVCPPSVAGCTNPSPGLYVFVANEFKAECPEWNFWFHKRMCHNGTSCGISYRPESEIGSFCKKGNPDGSVSTEDATGFDDAYRCLGNLRPVKVRVKPGDISNNTVCNPLK